MLVQESLILSKNLLNIFLHTFLIIGNLLSIEQFKFLFLFIHKQQRKENYVHNRFHTHLYFSTGCIQRPVKFAGTRLVWTTPVEMSSCTLAMEPRVIKCGFMILGSVFYYIFFIMFKTSYVFIFIAKYPLFFIN